MKKFTAIVLAFTLAFSLLPAVVFAAGGAAVPGAPEVTVKVNGNDHGDNNKSYHEGDTIEVTFTWDETKWENIDWGELPDTFEWPLGDFISKSSQGGTIYDGTESIGSWCISEDGKRVIFTFSENFKQKGTQDRHFDLTLTGEIPLDPEEKAGGENHDFKIGEEEFDFTVTYDGTRFDVQKSMSRIRNVDGKLVSTVTITAEIDGYAKGIVFCDAMGEKLSLNGDDITIKDETGKSYSFDKVPCTHGKSGFDLQLTDTVQDKTLTITYDVILQEGAVAEWHKDPEAGSIGNTIGGTFADANQIPKEMPDADAHISAEGELSLRKTGTLVDDDEIEWTITFNTGCFGELTKEMIKQMGMGDFTFLDTLGGGQELTEEFKQKWTDWDEASGYSLKLSEFEGRENDDGSWTYTLTYRTKILPDSSYPYTNSVSTDGNLNTRGNVFDPNAKAFDVNKSFSGENTDSGTMQWTVTVDVPGEEFTTLTITDTPQQDEANKYGYTHRVVKDSIVVTVGGAEYKALDSFKITYDRFGYTITIDAEKNSVFAELIKGKTVTITLETEAVTADNGRDGSLIGNFNWQNNVEATLSYPSPNKPDSTKKGSDSHAKTGKPDLQKSAERVPGQDGVFTWRILITGDTFVSRSSAGGGTFTGNFRTLDITINDTLPEGLQLKGDVYAVLYYSNYSSGEQYVDSFRTVLNDCLTVTQNGRELTIKWKDDSTLEEKFRALGSNEWPGNANTLYYLAICYQTELDRSSEILKNAGDKPIQFSNRAEGTIGGSPVGPTIATAGYKVKSALDKTYSYDLDSVNSFDENFKMTNGNYNVRYEIDINPERLTIGNAGNGMITLVDTMGKSLTPILASVQLQNADTGAPAARKDYSWSFDEDSNAITLHVRDGVHYKLIYYAILNEEDLKDPTTADTGNSVKMYGLGSDKSQTVSGPTAVLNPSSTGGSGNSTLTVIKFSNDTAQGTTFLEGAEFELYPVLYENGKFVKDTGSNIGDRVLTGTTEASGQTTFTFNIHTQDESTFHTNHIFCLRETKAPEGYVPQEEPIYFIFSTYTPTEANGNIEKEALLKTGKIKEYGLGEWIYFKNSKSTGDLTVSKTVTGTAGDTEKDFHFTVTLGDKTINGMYGDMFFVNGVAEFTLRDGESRTAKGLYEGMSYSYSYEVSEEEANRDGYTTTSTGARGMIEVGKSATATFVNHKDEPANTPETPFEPPEDPEIPPKTPEDPDDPPEIPEDPPDEPDNPPNNTPDDPPDPPPDDVPQTGDGSHSGLWLALMILSAMGMLGMGFFSNRKRTLFSTNGRRIHK